MGLLRCGLCGCTMTAERKKGKSFDLEKQYLPRYTVAVPLKVTTNAEGRFKLTGVGRNAFRRYVDRLANLLGRS
jgi:hypothetical protein